MREKPNSRQKDKEEDDEDSNKKDENWDRVVNQTHMYSSNVPNVSRGIGEDREAK